MRIWFCETCKQRFDYNKAKYLYETVACIYYGNKGRPPYSLPFNSEPLIARFRYCINCG